jgi:MoaA/NifB/PqqE/SkfB family radical SAM enzyme
MGVGGLGIKHNLLKKTVNPASSGKEEYDFNPIGKRLSYFIENQNSILKEHFSVSLGNKKAISLKGELCNRQDYEKIKHEMLGQINKLKLPKSRKRELAYLISYFTLIPLLPPNAISIDLSDRCNLRCKICNQWKDRNSNKKLEFEDLKKIMDSLASFSPKTIVEFSGQEPLLKKDLLFKILQYGTEKGILMSINTNGTLLNEGIIRELLKYNLNHITVSLDGMKESHNYIRNNEHVFDRSIDALKGLVMLKKAFHLSKPAVSVTFVITDLNFRELPKFHAFLGKLGVDTLNLNPFTLDNSYFFNKNATYENNEFWINSESIADLKKVLGEILTIKKKRIKPYITNTEKQLNMIPEYFKNKERYHKRICLAGLNYFHITNFGEVTICGKGPKLNIRDHGLEYIWNSQSIMKTRLAVQNCKTPCLNNCFELM